MKSGFLILFFIFNVHFLSPEALAQSQITSINTTTNQSNEDLLEYIKRITRGLSSEAVEAARDPQISLETLNDSYGLRAVLAALSMRNEDSAQQSPLSSRLNEVFDELGLPTMGQSLPPHAEHLMPPELSSQAFHAGVKLAKSPYWAEKNFNSLTEAIAFAEGHPEGVANAMAHFALQLFSKLVEKGRAEEQRLGSEQFEARLRDKEFSQVKLHGKGRAELNTVDKIKWQNIRVEGSEIAYIWENSELVHPNSKHAQRIIASQHLTGGKTRSDKQRGRDVIKVRYHWDDAGELKIETISFFPRHKLFSKEWIKDFVLYDGTLPSWNDAIIFGLIPGVWQSGVTSTFDLVQKGEVNWKITALTFFFGGIYCGLFSTNIRRLTNEFSRTDFQRLMANILVTSLPFALFYKVLHSGSISSISPFGVAGILTYVGLSIHFWTNNVTKVELQGLISDRSEAAMNTHMMLGVKASNMEQNLSYNLLSFPARIADLASFVKFTISNSLNLTMSGGKIWLVGLLPFARWARILNKEWLESTKENLELGSEAARRNWNRSIMGALVALPFGTVADLALAGKSAIFGGSKKNYIPQKDLYDYFRLIGYALHTYDSPSEHLQRIGQRWAKHSQVFQAQGERLSKFSGKVSNTARVTGHKLGQITRSSYSKCSQALRWLGKGEETHHPPY